MKIIEEVDIQNNSKTDFLNNNTTEKKNERAGNIFSLLKKLSKKIIIQSYKKIFIFIIKI